MVAKTPTKAKRIAAAAAALNPNLVRETLKKVDRCVARLQELQYTVAGGAKVVAGVNLSPRSTRGYLRTSLRCKQETLRLRTTTSASAKKSPPGKFQCSITGEWRRMSLPAMLLGETVVEILQATEFAKQVVVAAAATTAAATKAAGGDLRTPHTKKRSSCSNPPKESTPLRSRRMREKQSLRRAARSESSAAGVSSPPLPRARVRIRFKQDSPPRPSVAANRVSPRNRPWGRKAVLFPNPLFLPSSSASPNSPSSSHKQRFYKTRPPPIIGATAAARRNKEFQQTPHKFVIKSPPAKSLRSQLASKKAVPETAALRSPPPRARRCSFSPSKLASRLVSPLRTRMVAIRRSSEGLRSGLKQRPVFSTPVRVPSSRRGF